MSKPENSITNLELAFNRQKTIASEPSSVGQSDIKLLIESAHKNPISINVPLIFNQIPLKIAVVL